MFCHIWLNLIRTNSNLTWKFKANILKMCVRPFHRIYNWFDFDMEIEDQKLQQDHQTHELSNISRQGKQDTSHKAVAQP